MAKDDFIAQCYKIEALFCVLTNANTDHLFEAVPADQLAALRKFLYLQFTDLTRRLRGSETSQSEMQKSMVPVRYYFEKHDCDEIVDTCLADSCFENNDACFREKLSGQLTVQIRMLRQILFPEIDSDVQKDE